MSKPPFKLNSIAQTLARIPIENLARQIDATDGAPKTDRMLDFNGTPQEYDYLRRIMQRMRETLRDHVSVAASKSFDEHTAAMDLMCVHRNCMTLDFFELLTSSDDDFTHDVFGVGLHLDRRAGQLCNGFKPRCRKEKTL